MKAVTSILGNLRTIDKLWSSLQNAWGSPITQYASSYKYFIYQETITGVTHLAQEHSTKFHNSEVFFQSEAIFQGTSAVMFS